MKSTITASAAVVAAAAAAYSCPVPWSAVLLAAATILGIAAWRARGDVAKMLLANLAAVFVALAAFEAYLGLRPAEDDGTRMEGTIAEDFVHPDDDLGYAPNKGARVTARKRYGDTVVYDVTYTIGSDGLRVMPPVDLRRHVDCLLFFGDSVTFGEGVDDEQAYPYLIARRIGPDFAVYNFAFSGYGPHQMLALLRSGRIESMISCTPRHLFYLGIPEHVARVAGLTTWDRHGPRFAIDAQGAVVRDGNFDAPVKLFGQWAVPLAVAKATQSFLTWQRFLGRERTPGNAEVALYVAIVRESARIAHERYPGAVFHVILWDRPGNPHVGDIKARMLNEGIRLHLLTTAFPDLLGDDGGDLLFPHDGTSESANARAHRRLRGDNVERPVTS